MKQQLNECRTTLTNQTLVIKTLDHICPHQPRCNKPPLSSLQAIMAHLKWSRYKHENQPAALLDLKWSGRSRSDFVLNSVFGDLITRRQLRVPQYTPGVTMCLHQGLNLKRNDASPLPAPSRNHDKKSPILTSCANDIRQS